MPTEDEPFEFFRGTFSEIFISIGLVILLSGVAAMLAWFGGLALMTAVPLACAAIAWWWATYFTLKRRMTLPSMVLASAYGVGLYLFVMTVLVQGGNLDERMVCDWRLCRGGAWAWCCGTGSSSCPLRRF